MRYIVPPKYEVKSFSHFEEGESYIIVPNPVNPELQGIVWTIKEKTDDNNMKILAQLTDYSDIIEVDELDTLRAYRESKVHAIPFSDIKDKIGSESLFYFTLINDRDGLIAEVIPQLCEAITWDDW